MQNGSVAKDYNLLLFGQLAPANRAQRPPYTLSWGAEKLEGWTGLPQFSARNDEGSTASNRTDNLFYLQTTAAIARS